MTLHTLILVMLCISGCFTQTSAQSTESMNPTANPTPSDSPALDPLDDVETPDHTEWKERSFNGNSRYEISGYGDNQTIIATTDGQASVLYRQQSVDLEATPVITWRWKVAGVYRDIDETTQSGDDYPARLYVVIQTGLLPWETLAINYVWSSTGTVGDIWNNAFTDKARMVALQAGDEAVGQWRQEKRNVVEDFQNLFGIEVSKLNGYAVMIDGDNSNQQGRSWFSGIRFLTD